jgi:hypothetical protein
MLPSEFCSVPKSMERQLSGRTPNKRVSLFEAKYLNRQDFSSKRDTLLVKITIVRSITILYLRAPHTQVRYSAGLAAYVFTFWRS